MRSSLADAEGRTTGSDMHALRDQTVLNIRERPSRRKQRPFRRLYSRSERLRVLFGILSRLKRPRGLERHYAVLIFESRGARVAAQGEDHGGYDHALRDLSD